MNSRVHRLCVDQVLADRSVPEEQKIALRCFLKSWHGKDSQGSWMRSQRGWKESAALLASACSYYPCGDKLLDGAGRIVNAGSLRPYRILLCGFGQKLCGRPDHCRRCGLDRIDLAWSEFLPAWE